MAVYERATRAVEPAQQYDMFNIYIKRAAEIYGVTHTRSIYQKAIEVPQGAGGAAAELGVAFRTPVQGVGTPLTPTPSPRRPAGAVGRARPRDVPAVCGHGVQARRDRPGARHLQLLLPDL